MTNLETRLKRLEADRGNCRTIIAFSRGCTDDELDAAIARQGAKRTKADSLIHFCTIYEDRDGIAIPNNEPPHITLLQSSGGRP